MRENLPVYCETLLNPLGTFPAEPVNAATSFAPVIFGALALLYLLRQKRENRIAYALAVLTIFTGMGSIAWHASRTESALTFDALPGVIYFAALLFFWCYYLRGRYVGLILLVAIVALLVLLPPPAGTTNQIIIVVVIAAIASGLLIATWMRKREAFLFAALMIGGAVIALVLRTADLSLCATIPIGTHFFWHIFLGAAAYAGVRMMSVLKNTGGEIR